MESLERIRSNNTFTCLMTIKWKLNFKIDNPIYKQNKAFISKTK